MKKFNVPYSVIVQGVMECKAESAAQANIHARRWLSSPEGKAAHQALLDAGVGRIRVHANDISQVKEAEAHMQWTGQRFKKEED